MLALSPLDNAASGSSSSKKKKALDGKDVLNAIVDQLTSFSCSKLLNIRDAATDAALSLGKRIVERGVAAKEQRDTARRQIAAEEKSHNNKSKGSLIKNPKYQACIKQKEAATEVKIYCCF